MKKLNDITRPNQFKAMLALTKASFIAGLRNFTSVFFNFLFPLIFISIFGVLSFDNIKFDLGVREDSLKQGSLYEALSEVEVLKLVEKSDDEFDEMLKKGQIPVVISIEEKGFINTPEMGVIPQYKVTIEKSAADADAAATVTSVINGIAQEFNQPRDPNYQPMIELASSTIEGREYKQIDYILPGQLAFALLMNALFGISFSLFTLRKELVLKRIFATPVRRWTILGGEILSKVIMAVLQALVIILVGTIVFNFTLANGLVTFVYMMLMSLVGIVVFLSMGLLVVSIARSENALAPISQVIMMPQLFLSGAFFPIEAFPKFIQPIAQILPMTLLNDAFKMVAFEGSALADTLPQIGGLVAWAIVVYVIDLKLFKWES